jgi:outer membrane protein TolC
MKAAQDEVAKTSAAVQEAKDAFLPSAGIGSGLGASSGITLSVPTIFTANAQSLVFNSSQRDYIRAAKSSRESAALALNDVREQVEEDVAAAYVSLTNALEEKNLFEQQEGHVLKLLAIVEQRLTAGYDSELEQIKTKREVAELHLEQLELDHRIEMLRKHLEVLSGISENAFRQPIRPIPPESLSSFADLAPECPVSDRLRSSEAEARAKLLTSFGDSRYTWRPEATLQAQYGRISPFNSVSAYYNLHGNYNTLNIGVQLQLPLFDTARHARARQSAADAALAQHQADILRGEESESCTRLRESILEARAQKAVSDLDGSIAAVQLKETLVRLNASSSAGLPTAPVTPKDQERAELQAGEKVIENLESRERLENAELHYMKVTKHLEDWLRSLTATDSGQQRTNDGH